MDLRHELQILFEFIKSPDHTYTQDDFIEDVVGYMADAVMDSEVRLQVNDILREIQP